MSLNVTHQSQEHRFVCQVDGQEAELTYQMGAGRMVITHTYVPPAGRGAGVASALALAAFEFAKAQQLKVVPACAYISGAFLPRHPEYAALV